MRYSKIEVVRMFRNAFTVLAIIFLSVIVMSGYNIIKNDGQFWQEFTHDVFVDPALAIPFVTTSIAAVFLRWRHKKLKTA